MGTPLAALMGRGGLQDEWSQRVRARRGDAPFYSRLPACATKQAREGEGGSGTIGGSGGRMVGADGRSAAWGACKGVERGAVIRTRAASGTDYTGLEVTVGLGRRGQLGCLTARGRGALERRRVGVRDVANSNPFTHV
jgi:hypothetical protein